MSQPTTLPAQIVADTIIRTVELGVRITDAAVAGETTVLWCELLVDGPGRCPGCGITGTYRDTTERRVSDVPVVGHPLELRVRVPRYRCVHDGCARKVSCHDTSRPPARDGRLPAGARGSSLGRLMLGRPSSRRRPRARPQLGRHDRHRGRGDPRSGARVWPRPSRTGCSDRGRRARPSDTPGRLQDLARAIVPTIYPCL
jgi:hypothetical protein